MAQDHQKLKGIRCKECGKLLVAATESGLTAWDDRCKKAYLVVDILSEAIEQGYLSPKEVIKSIPALKDEVKKQISREMKRTLNAILYKPKK